MTKTNIGLLLFCSLLILPLLSSGALAELSPAGKSEVSHLLEYTEKSGCDFYRNGTWYHDTKAIREHMDRKIRYFGDRGRINSTEDFIAWAATKSEISGKLYMMKCKNGTPIPTSRWLAEELERYRRQQATGGGEK
jgi:hypothetical protein